MRKYAKIEGMSCEHCATRITHALCEIDGISDVHVILKKNTAIFNCDSDVCNQEVIDIIESLGYIVKEVDWE